MTFPATDDQTRINVAFSSDNNYAQHMNVSIASLLKHISPKTHANIYIIYNNLSTTHQKNAKELEALHPNTSIHFEKIDIKIFKNLPLYNSHHSIEVYFRLTLASMFPEIDYMLYLDSDIIIQEDISNLWVDYSHNDCMLCAVEEPSTINKDRLSDLGMKETSAYFNAGILLINLDKMRSTHFEKQCFAYIDTYKDHILYQDQDVLNAVCEGDWEALPLSWNAYYFIYQRIYDKTYYNYKKEDIQAAKTQPKIIHFNQHPKPWSAKCIDPRRRLYFKYLKYTPYKEFKVQHGFVFNSILKRHLNNTLLYLQETYPIIFNFLRSVKRSLSNH